MKKYNLNMKKLAYYMSYTSFLFPNIAKATLPAQNFYALYNVASAGKVHVISRAVSRGLNIDTINANGDTGLCVAIKRKDTTAYKLFMHFGANPNHSCILRIPQQQYIKFISRFPRQEIEYTSASARYAKYPAHNVNYVQRSNIYNNNWFSSPIGVTVGIASLIAGGVALAGGGGGVAVADTTGLKAHQILLMHQIHLIILSLQSRLSMVSVENLYITTTIFL